MGIACSHPPPPLVEVTGPRSKILVPAGTSFSVHPPPSTNPFARGRRHQRVPIYQRVPSPYSGDIRPRGRPRERDRRPPLSEDTESQMSFMDLSSPARARMRGGGAGRGYGPARKGMGMGGRRPRPGSGPGPGLGPRAGAYFDAPDIMARSAPDLHMGNAPPGIAPPRSRARLMSPMIARDMSPDVPGYAPTPGYGAMSGIPGGLGSGNPYAYPQGRGGTPFQGRTQTPLQMQPQRRASVRPPGLNEVPMGAYAAGVPAPPIRANTEPPISKSLNRVQPASKKIGPSSQEWIEGDPFLDACTCTTSCTCRKGQRVLYRSQAQDGKGHNAWGEIRYILKDDLGKDCGDHSKCRGSDRERKKSKKKGRGEVDNQSTIIEDKIDQAIKQKMHEMCVNQRDRDLRDQSRSPLGAMPSYGAHPTMVDGMGSGTGPRIGGDPYGMGGPGRMPGGPMGGRPDRILRMGMGTPGLMPGEIGYEDDIPFSESGFGMEDTMDPLEMGGRPRAPRGPRHLMPPGFMGPRKMRPRGGPRGPLGMDMEMGSFGRGPPMGGRGTGGRRARFRGRGPRPEFGDKDMEIGMCMRGGMGGRGGGREGYGDMEDDDDDAAWEDENDGEEGLGIGQSPSGRRRDGGCPRMGRHGSRGAARGRQARVEDDDDDIRTDSW